MRRMLDPKELGGGGDEKLYCHYISFVNDSNHKGGYIVLNYYSKKKDKFTYDTFKKEFNDNKNVACSGYIHDGDNYFTPFYLMLSKGDIYVKYSDIVNNLYTLTGIYWFTFRDSVSEVI